MKGPTMAKTTRKNTRKTTTKKAVAKIMTKTTVPEVVTPEPPIPEESTMGRYFQFRIQHGQNLMFAENGPKGMGLTDQQLAVLWNVNWPNRKVTYSPFHITGARRDYNKGKHGMASSSGAKIGKWMVNKDTNEYTYKEA
tara:strand:- start:36 stop:452 length:417 start_codon:yes stop_codon:yes gene_type:complete